MGWYLEVLRKYAVASGRARRREYWIFNLVNVIIALALVFVGAARGLGAGGGFSPLPVNLYLLLVMIPSIAVSIRRLHDTGRSAWWLWLNLVPLIGGIVLIVFMAQDSEEGENRYGPNPKASAP